MFQFSKWSLYQNYNNNGENAENSKSEFHSNRDPTFYKQSIDPKVGKQNRLEENEKIRKQKKQQIIRKKRGLDVIYEDDLKLKDWEVNGAIIFYQTEETDRVQATKGIQGILYQDDDTIPARIVNEGILSHLVKTLSSNNEPQLTLESLLAIGNLAATSQTQAVVDSGAFNLAMQFWRNSNDPEIKEACLLVVTNTASESDTLLEMVVQEGVIDLLLGDLKEPSNASLVNEALWSLSALTTKTVGEHEAVKIVNGLVGAFNLFCQLEDCSIISDGLNNGLLAFYNTTASYPSAVDAVANSGIVTFLVNILGDNQMGLQVLPALQALGNIVLGTNDQAQTVINAGILQHLQALLYHEDWEVQKQAAQIAANIFSGNEQQVDALFNTGILKHLALVALDNRWPVREEATRALTDFCAGHGSKYIRSFVDMNGVDALVGILTMDCVKEDLLCDILNALCKVLEMTGPIGRRAIEEFDGHEFINDLALSHPCESVVKKASNILCLYFGEEARDESENIVPMVTENNTFEFCGKNVNTSYDFSSSN